MGRKLRVLIRVLFVAGLGLSQTSCLIFTLYLTGQIDEDGKGTAKVSFQTAPCYFLGFPVAAQQARNGEIEEGCLVSCLLQLGGGDPTLTTAPLPVPSPIQIRSEYDFVGGSCDPLSLLFLDPLVVQMPDNVSGISGTFVGTNPASAGSLLVQAGLDCIDTLPGEQLCAESGNQLVILSLPANVTQGDIQATLNFTVTPAGPIVIKAVSTGRMVINFKTFYPILFPCVESFADAPSVTIPTGSEAQIPIPTDGLDACTREFQLPQQIDSSVGAPALSVWGVLLVALLAGAIGFARELHRRA